MVSEIGVGGTRMRLQAVSIRLPGLRTSPGITSTITGPHPGSDPPTTLATPQVGAQTWWLDPTFATREVR